ncbi:MAG: AmmeMemoRadiSam system protein B [bacterium]
MHTQVANVAGTFYPADQAELSSQIQRYLDNSSPQQIRPKALVVPHAGYIYSGPVAASAYRLLEPIANEIQRVIVLAPSHRVPFRGIATSTAEQFQTPLGVIPVDQVAVSDALQIHEVAQFDTAFVGEHALEVQLPFLQTVIAEFKLVPFVVGRADTDEVARLLEALWGGPETLIVISSDLSHYLDYDSARQRDQQTANAIEHLQPDLIEYEDACGRNPLNGLLRAARHHELEVYRLDLRNSGDTAGPRNQVVGYGAWALG